MNIKQSNLCCCGALLVGSTAMLGEMVNSPSLKGIGLASGVAPYTKVFCTAKDARTGEPFESFAADFYLRYREGDAWNEVQISPELYQRIGGSYNRRNVYGAVIAYGPALPEEMRAKLLHYAMKEPGNVAKELALPPNVSAYEVVIHSRTVTANGGNKVWKFKGE